MEFESTRGSKVKEKILNMSVDLPMSMTQTFSPSQVSHIYHLVNLCSIKIRLKLLKRDTKH
jgi:hypothetical protein